MVAEVCPVCTCKHSSDRVVGLLAQNLRGRVHLIVSLFIHDVIIVFIAQQGSMIVDKVNYIRSLEFAICASAKTTTIQQSTEMILSPSVPNRQEEVRRTHRKHFR